MAFVLSIPPIFISPTDSPIQLRQFYIVMRADVCQSQSDFESRFKQMTNEIRSEPSMLDERVQLANDPQIEESKRRQQTVIHIDDHLCGEFQKLSSELDVEML